MYPSSASLPEVLLSQVASYVQDEIQTVDPQCFRSATQIQAQFRAWLVRTYGDPDNFAVCIRCGESGRVCNSIVPDNLCPPCRDYVRGVTVHDWCRWT